MKPNWYLIGAVVFGIAVFAYVMFWCTEPCH